MPKHHHATPLNALFGTHAEIFEAAAAGDRALTVRLDGVSYPIVAATNGAGRDGVVYPHTKAVFLQHVRQAIALDDDAALRRLSHLNFLRDAFKAEVAVRHDAFFLTHDRLAYLYYRMLAAAQHAAAEPAEHGGTKGFLLIVRTTPAATRDDPTQLPDVRYEVLL